VLFDPTTQFDVLDHAHDGLAPVGITRRPSALSELYEARRRDRLIVVMNLFDSVLFVEMTLQRSCQNAELQSCFVAQLPRWCCGTTTGLAVLRGLRARRVLHRRGIVREQRRPAGNCKKSSIRHLFLKNWPGGSVYRVETNR
jgi:hypothetical protein